MKRSFFRARRGFSLAEIVIAVTILAIIGSALVRLVIMQARSYQLDTSSRRGRTVARSAINILQTDLRMAQDNGAIFNLDATNHRRIDVRVPVAFGVVCAFDAAATMIALVPVDSFQRATMKFGGYAVRNMSTPYAYSYADAASTSTITATPTAAVCHTAAGIHADTIRSGGRQGQIVTVTPAPPAGTAVGAPAFLYQIVSYEFKASSFADFSGKLGLYRVVRGKANTDTLSEELLAPFGSGARFSYYTEPKQANDTAATDAPGTPYNTVRGFRITLPAESADTIPGRGGPERFTTSTSVFFKNLRTQ